MGNEDLPGLGQVAHPAGDHHSDAGDVLTAELDFADVNAGPDGKAETRYRRVANGLPTLDGAAGPGECHKVTGRPWT